MPAPEGLEMVQGILSRSGYFTGGLHKMHLGPAGERQFDWYNNDLNTLLDSLTAAGDRPFFMWVGFTDPHRPYARSETPKLNDPSQVTLPPWLVDDHETRRDLADYYDEITRMDAQISEMLGAVERAGKLGNTLVLFISDNGAPFPRAKGTLYDAGIQTPFVASWPGRIAPGTRHNRLISVIDLAPTFLEIARVKVPSNMQGQSMAGGLVDPLRLSRTHAFSSRDWHNTDENMRSVRTERCRLITNAYTERPVGATRDIGRSPSFQSLVRAREAGVLTSLQRRIFEAPRPEVELYDLKSDPLELNNLAEDPSLASIRVDLLASIADWR